MRIFNTDNDADSTRSRGQVGIGTLIVFIAMVLVAAIAAGVLINTAGFLQTQAESTGTESTEQVANNLNIITEVGNVSDDDTINELRIGVQPAAGSDDINLAELTLQYVSDDEFANVIAGVVDDEDDEVEGSHIITASGDSDPETIGLADDDQARFLIDPVMAEDENDVVMTDNADRYELVIPLNDSLESVDYDVYDADTAGTTNDAEDADQGDLAPLNEGDEVEITITTEVGAQTIAFLQVPDSLAGDDPGNNVSL